MNYENDTENYSPPTTSLFLTLIKRPGATIKRRLTGSHFRGILLVLTHELISGVSTSPQTTSEVFSKFKPWTCNLLRQLNTVSHE